MGLLDVFTGKTKEEDWAKQSELQNWNDIVYTRKALDMDVIWDGYDLVAEMTRIVDAR